MTRPMPPWLVDRIGDRGGALVGPRHARRVSCRSCGAQVWRGLDADVGAFLVSADVEPLTAAEEFAAHWYGLKETFALRNLPARRVELARRDHWQIRGEPAGTRETGTRSYVVLAEHVCTPPKETPA